MMGNIATRARLIGIGAMSLLMVVTAGSARASRHEVGRSATIHLVSNGLSWILPIGVLAFASSAFGDLLEDGSLVYLWLRPIRGWVPVAAAWTATMTVCLPVVVLPMALTAAVLDPDGPVIAGIGVAAAVGCATYSGLFVTAGLLVRRALPWCLGYVLIWEGFVAGAGQFTSRLAVRAYTASIVARTSRVPLPRARVPIISAVVTPLVVVVVVLAFASYRYARVELD
jgi:ABC-2 type transport system permease protein